MGSYIPCGCAQTMWSCLCSHDNKWLRQQTKSKTNNVENNPTTTTSTINVCPMSAHLPSKHRLISTPTHHINIPSPLQAAACRVAMVAVLGHDNQQPDVQWMSSGGRHEANDGDDTHLSSPSRIFLFANPGEHTSVLPPISLSDSESRCHVTVSDVATKWWTTNVVVHHHRTDTTQPNKWWSKCGGPQLVLTSPVAVPSILRCWLGPVALLGGWATALGTTNTCNLCIL